MKSVHAGRREVDIDSVRQLILAGGGDGGKLKDYDEFYMRLCGSPYRALDPRHVQLLWRVLCRQDGKSLNEVLRDVDARGDLESLARRVNRKMAERFLNGEVRGVPLASPSAQVMFNSFDVEG